MSDLHELPCCSAECRFGSLPQLHSRLECMLAVQKLMQEHSRGLPSACQFACANANTEAEMLSELAF
jgi:hypothetical protein